MYHLINKVVETINFDSISADRKTELQRLIDYIQVKKDAGVEANLIFVCTHNSRRSQFSQIWAKVAAEQYGIAINSFSGGVEVTEFNKKAVESLKRFGFSVDGEGGRNGKYTVEFDIQCKAVDAFSKLVEDEANPKENFAAIMTCADADENCPIVVGCEDRIPIRYDDPKVFDDSPLEFAMYDYRSFEIATEMFYVFSRIK